MKKSALWFVVPLLFCGPMSFADSPGLCEDLASFSCAPGQQDDGTGKSLRDGENENSPETVFNEKKDFIKNQFIKALQDPQNTYFKKLTVSGMELINSPACHSQKQNDIDKCNQDAADGLVQLAKKIMIVSPASYAIYSYSYPGMQPSTPDLKAISAITANQNFKNIISTIQKEISKETAHPEFEKKLKDKIIPQVQDLLAKKISLLPIDDKQKNFMIEKVRSIKYIGTDCNALAPGLAENFVANAFYAPRAETFTVCKGLISDSASEFGIVEVIAHELAHSIDPCNISQGPTEEAVEYKNTGDLAKMQEEYPVKGLIACLRTSKSAHAINFIQNPLPIISASGQYSTGYPTGSPPAYPSGNMATSQPPASNSAMAKKTYSFCLNDQIAETVADWFGTEVMADYINQNYPSLTKEQWQIGASNAFRSICDPQKPTDPGDNHPNIRTRINAIVLQNPEIRKKMGCTKTSSKYIYCDPKNPEAMRKIVNEDYLKSKKMESTASARKSTDKSSRGAQ